jgi:hypothetical protein
LPLDWFRNAISNEELLSANSWQSNVITRINKRAREKPRLWARSQPALSPGTAAQHLSSVGHNVTILTSDVFRDKVIAAGLDFVSLMGIANFDYRRLEDFFPDKRNLRGMDLTIHYFKHAFGDTIPDQDQCIRQIMAERPIDLILVDVPYLGAFPLLLGLKNSRPPIVGCGVVPLLLTSVDFGRRSKPDTDTGRITAKQRREPPVRDCFPTSH